MKLKLKHLAPYLPHNLNMFFGDEDIAELVGIDLARLHLISNSGDYGTTAISHGKPILHPLSDLTKEVEVNGEKFLPIVEMAKIADCHFKPEFSPKEYEIKQFVEDEVNVIQVHWKETESSRFDPFEFSYSYHPDSNIDSRNDGVTMTLDRLYMTHNNYNILQVLFKYHFDFFNLIPQNLAIDINTIQS